GGVAGPGYNPLIRIAGSSAVYSAPIIATGDGPFDVVHHTNTGDRVLRVHIAPPSPAAQCLEWGPHRLFVKASAPARPCVYISPAPAQPLTAVLERATYVHAVDAVP